MSISAQAEIHDNRMTPAVRGLLAACLVVAFAQLTLIREPNPLEWLGFSPGGFEGRWWTPFTHMFVHSSLWLLALNVYALWLFGSELERAWSSGELLRYFVLCSLGGLLVQVLFFRESLLVGASAGVYGIMLAYARRWPDETIFVLGLVPVNVRWLVVAILGASLVAGLGSVTVDSGAATAGGVAHLAHLGGFVVGWIYLRVIGASDGERLRPHISPMPDYPDDTPRAIPRGHRPRERREDEVDEIVAQSKAAVARKRAQPPAPTVSGQAEETRPAPELDRLLDKISREGLGSLTGEERKLLEDASRKLRGSE